jgi:predicted ATPase/signal transduction histidine kinase
MTDQINLPGYKLLTKETETETSCFYRGYSTVMKKQVLIKVLKNYHMTSHEAASIYHEYNVSGKLEGDFILRPLNMGKHLNSPYIVFEYFPCITVSELFLSNPGFHITDSLQIAVNIASALSYIHQQQIIHKNINPENILINPKTYRIKLTGFNHATTLKQENYFVTVRPNAVDCHLPYISPEQTGRMNRSMDYRTDLYSLGVTLYQLFTGKLPFTSNDPIKLVHAHLARMPLEPKKVKKDIPDMVSAIIMKLLAKTPESRYSSAFGVKEDLVICLTQLHSFGKVEPFQIGKKDINSIFESACKLYGREQEVKQIETIFNQVRQGDLGFVLIYGNSGMGKTSLVNEIHKPLVGENGYFISGKFEQLHRQVPYAPIMHAFQSLIRQIMTESPILIQRWKEKLEQELTGNIAMLTTMIPELKWLLGEQTYENESLSSDTQKQFLFTFQQFVNIFAAKNHPLVLFLDDLQWADLASLELIEYLVTQGNCQYLMLIGAYRDNEVGVTHPLLKTIQRVREADIPIKEVPLHTLGKENIQEWVEDSLMDRGEHVADLSAFLHRITQGNPLYMKQLLQSYYEDGYLLLEPNKGKWIADIKRITDKPVKEDIVDFIVERIRMLPKSTQHLLRLSSCIGNKFNLKTLSIISGSSYREASDDLWPALEAGLIIPNGVIYQWVFPEEENLLIENDPPAYRFLHDKVQQAIYSTMTKEEQEQAHVTIGRLLVMSSHHIEDQLFTIVKHFNLSKRLLNDHEILQVTEWNIDAGERAKASAAFQEALKYFETAKKLISDNWKEYYPLTFRFMKGLGECQYLTSQFEKAEKTFNDILLHAQSPYEKLEIYNLKITLYTHVHRVKDAVKSGIEGLRLFGIHLPENPGMAAIIKEYVQTKLALNGKSKEDLLNFPEITNKDQYLILQTFISMNGPAFHANQNLATLLMLRALRFTLKNGLTDISALVFNNYSLILSSGFNDYKGSYEFSKLAYDLAERYGVVSIKGRVQFVFGTFVNHWKNPVSKSLTYLETSQRYCLEAGNIHLAGANSSFIVITLFIKGTPIEEVMGGIDKQIQFVSQIQYSISKGFMTELYHWLQFLNGGNPVNPWKFKEILDDDSAKIIHYTLRLQMAYLFDQRDFAKELLQALIPLVSKRLTLVIVPEYYFYHGLWLSRFYNVAVTEREKRSIRKRMNQCIKKLKKWAELAPENYLHKYLLLKAEMAGLKQEEQSIFSFYNDSINYAEKHGFIQDVAICNECAARYFARKGHTKLANAFFLEAYQSYLRWGAKAKAQQILEDSHGLIPSVIVKERANEPLFDIHAALQATQSISKEIILSKLLNKLLDITMEYGGADRGFLMYKRDDQLVIGAQKSLEENEMDSQIGLPISGMKVMCESIIRYVESSTETIVLDDASSEGMFTEDHYIKHRKLKSLLCLPIIKNGNLIGILYLENNKATHAFTEEMIHFLSFLSTQAAISIENAYLYENLEANVTKRTEELKNANRHLEELNQELEQSRQSRRHFLSNISHDLRAPITSIKGYLEAILDGVIKEENLNDFLLKSMKRIDDLQLLIQDLFQLSQLESGQIQFSFDFIPVDRLMNHIYQKYEYEIVNNGLICRFDNQLANSTGLPPMVEVDLERMELVFSNLITNAIKYTTFGEIIFLLRNDDDLKQVILSIRDTGPGIPKEELPFVFDRYYSKTSNTANQKGHGLGLSICKEIITNHNGEIWVESEEGKGTTFSIRLPIVQYVEEVEMV